MKNDERQTSSTRAALFNNDWQKRRRTFWQNEPEDFRWTAFWQNEPEIIKAYCAP
jgi:hypothetical protein